MSHPRPCRNCRRPLSEHAPIQGKCLFAPTTYVAMSEAEYWRTPLVPVPGRMRVKVRPVKR